MTYLYGKNLDADVAELWRQSHELYRAGYVTAAYKIYRELRRDHGVELFYEIEPPPHVRFVHPIGCVLGRAQYGSHNVFYQCSGVGSDLDGNRPTLGDGVVLFPGARVLGRATVGSNVIITANTVVQDCVVPSNVIVYSAPSYVQITGGRAITLIGCSWRSTKRNVIEEFFK